MTRAARWNRRELKEMISAAVKEVLAPALGGGAAGNQDPKGDEQHVAQCVKTVASEIKIERGIPVPTKSDIERWKSLYDRMAPGDSFVASLSDSRSFVYYATKSGGKVATRTVGEGKTMMVRVWLIGKKAMLAN